MKAPALIVVFLFAFTASWSTPQNGNQPVTEEYSSKFNTEEDRENMEQLRNFLDTKDAQYLEIQRNIVAENSAISDLDLDSNKLNKELKMIEDFIALNIKDTIRGINSNASFFESKMSPQILSIVKDYEVRTPLLVEEAHDLASVKENILKAKSVLSSHQEIISNYNKSLKAIDNDRHAALNQLQKVYEIEKSSQTFKITMSCVFAGIILMLLGLFFWFLFKKSGNDIGNLFLQGNGIQFITLFAIIISTILFGILDILEGRELAAILSGIAGFILGKGFSNPDEKTKSQQQTQQPVAEQPLPEQPQPSLPQ